MQAESSHKSFPSSTQTFRNRTIPELSPNANSKEVPAPCMLSVMAIAQNRPTPIATAICFMMAWLVLGLPIARIADRDFEVDEAEYLTIAVHSMRQAMGETDASVGGQLVLPTNPDPWKDGIHDSTFGFQSPGLPKLLFGITGVAAGVGEVDALVFPRFAEPGLSRGAAKERRLAAREAVKPALSPGRALTRVLTSIIAALLFAIASSVASSWAKPSHRHVAGVLAAALWLASPVAWEASAYVRPGLLPIVFWCAALLLTLTVERTIFLSIGLGICCGLATAGKLNGILIAPLVPYFLFNVLRGRGIDRRQAFRITTGASALAGTLAFAIFLLFSPGLWHDTLSGVSQTLRMWTGDLAHQASIAPDTATIASGPMHSLQLGFSGLVSFASAVPYAGAVLLPLGLAALARGSKQGQQPHVDRVVLAWSALLLLASALLIPMDRARYILPMIAPAALVQALLIARVMALYGELRTAKIHD